jgi:hypothetical protein
VHGGADREPVVAGGGDRDPVAAVGLSRVFIKLVVAKLVEGLDYPRSREAVLDDGVGGGELKR